MQRTILFEETQGQGIFFENFTPGQGSFSDFSAAPPRKFVDQVLPPCGGLQVGLPLRRLTRSGILHSTWSAIHSLWAEKGMRRSNYVQRSTLLPRSQNDCLCGFTLAVLFSILGQCYLFSSDSSSLTSKLLFLGADHITDCPSATIMSPCPYFEPDIDKCRRRISPEEQILLKHQIKHHVNFTFYFRMFMWLCPQCKMMFTRFDLRKTNLLCLKQQSANIYL